MHLLKLHRLQAWCVYAFLLSVPVANGQPNFRSEQSLQFNATTLQGQIIASDSADRSHLLVLIVDNSRRSVLAEVQVSVLGTFETPALSPGIYELRVVTRDGNMLRSMGVSVPYQNTLTIELSSALANVAARPISLSRLQHKVPKKAQTSYFSAQKASEKGDRQSATLHLERAVTLDPQFFEAANNLGVMYLQSGRLCEAFEMFQRATTIDSSDPLAEANLAYVLLSLNRFSEAEAAARASVRSDALSPRARFFLAVSLLEQNKERKEAIFQLTKASLDFEPARKLLVILKTEKKLSY